MYSRESIKVFLVELEDLPTTTTSATIQTLLKEANDTYLQVILHPLRIHRLRHRRPIPPLNTPTHQDAPLWFAVLLGEAFRDGVGEDG